MSELRTIKKYPNRRLYDTVESRYITLSDIRRLVIERVDFVVIDKKSQEDITRSILLQVIAEQEHGGEPLMSRVFLSQIIRSYGGATQGMIGSYLSKASSCLPVNSGMHASEPRLRATRNPLHWQTIWASPTSRRRTISAGGRSRMRSIAPW